MHILTVVRNTCPSCAVSIASSRRTVADCSRNASPGPREFDSRSPVSVALYIWPQCCFVLDDFQEIVKGREDRLACSCSKESKFRTPKRLHHPCRSSPRKKCLLLSTPGLLGHLSTTPLQTVLAMPEEPQDALLNNNCAHLPKMAVPNAQHPGICLSASGDSSFSGISVRTISQKLGAYPFSYSSECQVVSSRHGTHTWHCDHVVHLS